MREIRDNNEVILQEALRRTLKNALKRRLRSSMSSRSALSPFDRTVGEQVRTFTAEGVGTRDHAEGCRRHRWIFREDPFAAESQGASKSLCHRRQRRIARSWKRGRPRREAPF